MQTGWREPPLNFLIIFFDEKIIKLSACDIILSPMSSHWIDCLFSGKHSSYYSSIVFYINIFWLKHESFDFKASISYSYLIIVLLSHPCWPHRPPQSHLSVWHFLVLDYLFYLHLCPLFVQ